MKKQLLLAAAFVAFFILVTACAKEGNHHVRVVNDTENPLNKYSTFGVSFEYIGPGEMSDFKKVPGIVVTDETSSKVYDFSTSGIHRWTYHYPGGEMVEE